MKNFCNFSEKRLLLKGSTVSIKVCNGHKKSVEVRSYTRVRNGKTEKVIGYIRKSWGSEE